MLVYKPKNKTKLVFLLNHGYCEMNKAIAVKEIVKSQYKVNQKLNFISRTLVDWASFISVYHFHQLNKERDLCLSTSAPYLLAHL